MAIHGDTIVVGAPHDFHEADSANSSSRQGSAYVFTRSGTIWSQQAKLTASDAAGRDYLGIAVAISGDTVVVGADQGGSQRPGAAYVFVCSGTAWSEQAKLTASDAEDHDRFGHSVALSGDTAVVGAVSDDDAGDSSGAAYVFVRSGNTWSQQAKLTASDAAERDTLGRSVALRACTTFI